MRGPRRVIIWCAVLLLAPLVLLGALYAWVAIRAPRPDSAVLVRTSDRRLVWTGERARVSLYINLDKAMGEAVSTTPRPAIFMLLIDHSSSMGDGPESALEIAREAAAAFAEFAASPSQPVGAVMFDDSATVVSEIGTDGPAIAKAISAIQTGGGTDIAEAVRAGDTALQGVVQAGTYGNALPTLILLSDGQSQAAPALQAAADAKARGVRVVTIGLGSQIDQQLLQDMASSPDDFHYTLDATALSDVYADIAADVGTVVGYQGQLAERFHYGAFTLSRPPLGLNTQVDATRGHLDIRLPVLYQRRMKVSYIVTADRFGLFGLGLDPARLTFLPDGNKPDQRRELVSSLQPSILVISWPLLLFLYLPLLGYLWSLIHRWLISRSRAKDPVVIPNTTFEPPGLLAWPPREALRERQAEPTFFIGIGESGRRILESLINLLAADRYGSRTAPLPFALSYVDVRDDAAPSSSDGRVTSSKVQLPNRMTHFAQSLQENLPLPEHFRWVPLTDLRDATGVDFDLSKGAQGRRWLGRLSLFAALARKDEGFWTPWKAAVDWLRQHQQPRIVLLGSLESGTASGLLADVAHLIRRSLPPSRRAESMITALAIADVGAPYASAAKNQVAFLTELDRLTVAAHIPQARNYTEPGHDTADLTRGQTDERLFDRFFLMQAAQGSSDEIFEQAAVVAHTLTERSYADRIDAHLASLRPREELVHTQQLVGTLDTAREYVVRWPASELARRLACRFVKDILGEQRLVGVTTGTDGTRLSRAPVPRDAVEQAIAAWGSLHEYHRRLGTAYQAYCQAAADGDPRKVVATLRNASRHDTPETFGRGMRDFCEHWFYLLLNGRREWKPEENAAWRRHKILLVEALLVRLSEVGTASLALVTSDTDPVRAILRDVSEYHAGLLQQVRRWLEILVGAELDSTSQTPVAGVYRMANDEYAAIEQRIVAGNRAAWQKALWGDEIVNLELREDALYRDCFRTFLDAEHGFLLRWIWQFARSPAQPELVLRLVTDEDHVHRAEASTAAALYARLHALAEAQTRQLDKLTIVQALQRRGEEASLDVFARSLAMRFEHEPALTFDKQAPGAGADDIARRAFVMVPDVADPSLDSLARILRERLLCDATIVRHGDPHSIRVLLTTSLIPIASVLLRPASRHDLPYVEAPEREAERLRDEMERRGLAPPSMNLHPLVRLLTGAPRSRAEWVGILAEDDIRPGYAPGGTRRTLVVANGTIEEPLLRDNQPESYVWAILNLALKTRGVAVGEALRDRWSRRSTEDQVERLRHAIDAWRERVDKMATYNVERIILLQIVQMMELELDALERRINSKTGAV